jgi:GTP-binding protein EngB required for normal cell division
MLASARYADKLLSDIEGILNSADSQSPFSDYRMDLTLHQARLIRSNLVRFRQHLSRTLSAIGVEHGEPRFGAMHAILVTLTFVRIAVEEMTPERMRGYGELSEEAAGEVRGLCAELLGLLDNLERALAMGTAADLQARLSQISETVEEVRLLKLLDRVVNENDLTEFQAPLLNIAERLGSPQLEIAIFGRVSSGKSSLLNRILRTDVLPVGVNPITAVPTRLVYGPEPILRASFADRQVKTCPIEDLALYASEERNPGNELGVTRLVVELPSERLQDGLVFVDTPGLGTLARAGAGETKAYLPQCDLGVVLVSAASPINDADLETIHALSQAGIPVMVLLSKADLLSSQDLQKALSYTRQEILLNLGLEVDVRPVSAMAEAASLMEEWFHECLEPLFARRRELARQSVVRKTLALQGAVIGALRARLSAALRSVALSSEDLEEVERRLRAAAGQIEATRKLCLQAADEIRLLGESTLRQAVSTAGREFDGSQILKSRLTPIVLASSEELAAAAAAQISMRLQALADELDSALRQASQAVAATGVDDEGPLKELVREMPRFEASLPQIQANLYGLKLPFGLKRVWLMRQLRNAFLHHLESAFASYSRSLERWLRNILGELHSEFEARAGAYREQLARLRESRSVLSADRSRIERSLRELENFQAASENLGKEPPESNRTSGSRVTPSCS